MDETTTSNATAPQSAGADLLGTLLSNPEWLGRIKSILTSAVPSASEEPPPQNENRSSNEPSAPTILAGSIPQADGLSKLVSDPALLAKLPSILTAVKPLLSGISIPTATPKKEDAPKSLPVCRDNLLLALKPFLSPERCQAIDSMLRIAKLGEILGQLK